MALWDKSQWVRLIDIFILGPFMIWYALRYHRAEESVTVTDLTASLGLFVAGVLTIAYNAMNYLGLAST